MGDNGHDKGEDKEEVIPHPGPRPKEPRSLWPIVAGYAIFCILFVAASAVGFFNGPATEYEREVNGHLRNAYSAPTPELIRSELVAMKEGMRNLSLSEDLYAKYFSWEKTAHTSMAWQYQKIDAAIQRTDDVIAWRDALSTENKSELKDVYNEKIQNLHNLIDNDHGNIAQTAYDAYMLNYHPFYAWWWIFAIVLPLSFVMVLSLVQHGDSKRRADYRSRDHEWYRKNDRYEYQELKASRLKAEKEKPHGSGV